MWGDDYGSKGSRVYCNWSEVLLCFRGMCGERPGSHDDESGGGGLKPHWEDHLSGGVPFSQGLWDLWKSKAVRGDAEGQRGQCREADALAGPPSWGRFLWWYRAESIAEEGPWLYCGSAQDVTLYRIQHKDLWDLSKICSAGGLPCIFHRRDHDGCDALSGYLCPRGVLSCLSRGGRQNPSEKGYARDASSCLFRQDGRSFCDKGILACGDCPWSGKVRRVGPWACRTDHPGYPHCHRNYGHGRDWDEPVPVQGGHGYLGEAHSSG